MATPDKQIAGIMKRSPAVRQILASILEASSQAKCITLQIQRMDRQLLDGKLMSGKSLKTAMLIAANTRNAYFEVGCSIFLLGNNNTEVLSEHDFSVEVLYLPDHITWDGKSRHGGTPLSGMLRLIQVMEYDRDSNEDDAKMTGMEIKAVLFLPPKEKFEISAVPNYRDVLCEFGEDDREDYFLCRTRRTHEEGWAIISARLDVARSTAARV